MKTRHYEFICMRCGVSYLRNHPDTVSCPNVSCQEPFMELIAIVDIDHDLPSGVPYIMAKKVIDKPKRM
jgi:hypothetical protein